jgi:diacylglycerol O-acyltransferase / wax synthase
VRPLDGPDLFHLAQERPGRPMHTLKVAVLERPVPPDEVDRWTRATLTAVEPLRRRLVGLPRARPVWIDGGAPEPARHLEQVALPSPGGEAELVDLLSDLCGRPLDQELPLWRLWHVTGLAGGRDALVFQVHHALADGNGSVTLWEAVADGSEQPSTGGDEPEPTRRQLAAFTTRHGARELARLPGRIVRFGRSTRAAKRSGVVEAYAGPPTRFNLEPEAARRCAFVALPLGRLRAAARASGATLNDAFLTICGGALRRHLEAEGEPPTASLTATVPAALPDRAEPYGNSVTTLYVSLHSDVVDPEARLTEVQRSVAATRQVSQRDPRVLADLQRHPLLYRALIKGMEAAERRRQTPAYNVTVSNVRGPGPLSILGVPVVELRSLGPLVGHFGLNITGWSYADDFTVGLHTYASGGEGLDRLAALLPDELEALGAAVDDGGSP